MKKTIVIAALSAVVTAVSAPVTPDQAKSAATGWIREGHKIAEACRCVTSVIPVPYPGEERILYYKAVCGDAGTVMVSADTDLPPIMAFIPGKSGHDGSAPGSALWSLLRRNCSYHPDTNGALKASSSSYGNNVRWRNLMAGRRPLKAASSDPDTVYVIPGFESGGRYTHWNQSATPEQYPTWFSVYDYYMVNDEFGGPSGGLPISAPPSKSKGGDASVIPPCGCTATAWAAAFQCVGVTGAVSRAWPVSGPFRVYYDPGSTRIEDVDRTIVRRTVYTAPGEYDWDSLPVNFGGLAPYRVLTENDLDVIDLLGRVTYNCGVTCGMTYDFFGSGAYPNNLVIRQNDFVTSQSFPGFSTGWMCLTARSGEEVGNFIRSGLPAVVTIGVSSAGLSSPTHCVLYTGHDRDTGMFRVFFGWGGKSDGWIHAKTSGLLKDEYCLYGVYDRDSVPLFGRVVDPNGNPVGGAFVEIRSGDDSSKVLVADSLGYFRGTYPASTNILVEGSTLVDRRYYVPEEVTVGTSYRSVRRYVGDYTGYKNSPIRLQQADIGAVVVTNYPVVTTGTTFYSGDGDLTRPLFISETLARKLMVIGGGSGKPSGGAALEYVVKNGGSLDKSMFSCYAVTPNLAPGEYIILSPGASALQDPYKRSKFMIGYGSSASERDVAETIRKALSQR